MRVLCIVTNIFIFSEQMSVLNKLGVRQSDRINYIIDKDYNKNNERVAHLIFDIKHIFNNAVLIDKLDNINNYDYILTVSHITDYVFNILKYVKDIQSKLILVEDGGYDYTDKIDKDYPIIKREVPVYVFRPSQIENKLVYKEINTLRIDDKIIENMFKYYKNDLSNTLKNNVNSTILFTSPIDDDFGYNKSVQSIIEFMENNLGNNDVIIKRHPRDHSKYYSDKLNFTFCPNNIPGQLLCKLFTGNKLFMYPSTIAYMLEDNSQTTVIKIRELEKLNKNYDNEVETGVQKLALRKIYSDEKLTKCK